MKAIYIIFVAFFFGLFLFLFFSFADFKISRFLADITQQLIIEQVNPVRQTSGFLELQPDERLMKAAQMKAEDMIKRNYFSHKGPDGEAPWSWLEKVNYNYSAAGENLAMDISDPEILIKSWLGSPNHAKNILNVDFTDIGVGLAKGKMDNKKTIVVVMFLGKEGPSKTGAFSESPDLSPQEPLIIKSKKENSESEDLIISQQKIETKPMSFLSRFVNLSLIFILRHLP